jgi:hypothetical protein
MFATPLTYKIGMFIWVGPLIVLIRTFWSTKFPVGISWWYSKLNIAIEAFYYRISVFYPAFSGTKSRCSLVPPMGKFLVTDLACGFHRHLSRVVVQAEKWAHRLECGACQWVANPLKPEWIIP